MHRVAVHEQDALAERMPRAPERVGVVPDLGLGVLHKLELHAIALFELRLALIHPRGREAGDHHHVVDPHLLEIRDREIEDRALVVDLEQRLWQVVGERLKPSAGSRRKHHPDHSFSSSSA